MTAVKRCPRCGQVKPAAAFYRRVAQFLRATVQEFIDRDTRFPV